ncbi:hypothetical protein V7793_16455 [Streptomyces sp. KLMMK]|uniref:hypothetical protein n=1 Tax=Streptomyces sp. KLMMK TaxID=3109353 RepID=UPI00300BC904
MSTQAGAWTGGGYTLTPEQNRVITERWERAAAARGGMDAMMKGIQQETRAQGGKLEGLEYSLKDVDSFRRKAATALKNKRTPVAKTAKSINDLNRYTLTFESDTYTQGVEQTYGRLREAGYEPTAEKNTWEDPVYKGINTTWQHTESGERFELQFHTPESFDAKMENHELYELSRGNDLMKLAHENKPLAASYQDAANSLQSERYKNVKVPPGQERIGERLVRDKLNPGVPKEHVELVRQEETKLRAENLAKAQAKAEAKAQVERAALGLDGPGIGETQGLGNKLATKSPAEEPRQKTDVPRIDPVPTQSQSRGPVVR